MVADIRLGQEGQLYIRRKTGMVLQQCPYSNQCCGHHCPKFVEPEYGIEKDRKIVSFSICDKEFKLILDGNNKDNFTDSRVKQD